jgi:hypothetical protein
MTLVEGVVYMASWVEDWASFHLGAGMEEVPLVAKVDPVACWDACVQTAVPNALVVVEAVAVEDVDLAVVVAVVQVDEGIVAVLDSELAADQAFVAAASAANTLLRH